MHTIIKTQLDMHNILYIHVPSTIDNNNFIIVIIIITIYYSCIWLIIIILQQGTWSLRGVDNLHIYKI